MENTPGTNEPKKTFGLLPGQHRLSHKALGVVVLITLVASYLIAWNIVRGKQEWVKKASELLSQGRFEESLTHFEKALDKNPKISLAWAGKGLCLMNLGRYEEALNSFDEALKIDQIHPAALLGKGLCLASLKRYEQAVPCLTKYLEINPGDKHILALRDSLRGK